MTDSSVNGASQVYLENSTDYATKHYILTLSEIFLYKQRRSEACIILQQCTRRSYYLPMYFYIEGAILFEKSEK
jgi:hypothetical protein